MPRSLLIFTRFRIWLPWLTLALIATGALSGSNAHGQSSVIAVDSFNRKVHVAGDANERRPVGGLAKIATAMVTLDWAEASRVGVNVLATVPVYAPQIAGVATLGLQPGDKLTLRDLIYATMMSGDDLAPITLAEFVGRDHLYRLQRGGPAMGEFVRQMNNLAAREGATHTRFGSPHGFDSGRAGGYSTAADIARLSLYAMSRPAMRFYTNQRSRNITVYRSGGQLSVPLTNTNPLLGFNAIDGVITGSTVRSGGCIAISAERPATVYPQPDGSSTIYRHRMVVVVVGSANPAAEAQGLLAQAWNAYDRWLAAGRPITDQKQLLNYF